MKKNHQILWEKIRVFSSWYFVVGLVVCLSIAVISLRQNNLTALNLKEKVSKADRQGSDIEGALRDLRVYVYGHMNTNLADGPNAIKPPIQLKYEYERLMAARKPLSTTPIPDALYKFDFVSPIWSPDVAGWSVLLSVLFGLLLVVRLSLEFWFGYSKKQYQ